MKLTETSSEALRCVLRSLQELNRQAWCFLPLDGNSIQFCSSEFLDLWRLPAPRKVRDSIVVLDLSLSSRAFHHTAKQVGVPESWLHKVTPGRDGVSFNHADGLRVRAVAGPVFDDQGHPLGRVVLCEAETRARLVQSTVRKSLKARAELDILSPRELQIMQNVCEGYTNKAIAIRSKISEKTVEKHRANIMQKLGLRNVVELARLVTLAEMAKSMYRAPETAE